MKHFRNIAGEISGALLLLVAALAALKYGTLAALPEEPAFLPRTPADWLIAGFPVSSFGIVAGAALLTALLSGGRISLRAPAGKAAMLLGFLLPVAALPGAIASPQRWIVADHLHLFFSAGAITFAAAFYVRCRPERKNALFFAVFAGCVVVALAALDQYFFTLDATRALVREEMSRGVYYSPEMLAKIYDDRVFATMTSANVLAGFLLLTSPVAVVGAWHFGRRYSGRTAIVTAVIAAALTSAVFLLTKTRGAFLAAILTATLAFLAGKNAKKWKILFLAGAVAVVGAGAWYIHSHGRGFSSATERAGYLATVASLTREHPLAGGGWGSFFITHMQTKSSATGETPRDPHNIVLSFAAQCGIPAGIAVAAALFAILRMLYIHRKTSPWHGAVFLGATGFLLHSMVEVNHLVPGNLALFGLLTVCALPGEPPEKTSGRQIPTRTACFLLGVAALTLSCHLLRRDFCFARYIEAVKRGNVALETTRRHALLEAAPDAPFVREAIGDAAWRKGNFAEAESFWRQAWTLDRCRPSLCRRLAMAARQRGNHQEAMRWEKKARELFPSRPVN